MKKAPLSSLFLCASVMALLLGFDSCTKTDNPVTPATTIEGSYKITALTADPKVLGTFSDLIAASKLLFSNTTCLNDLTITFKADGTATTDNPNSCQSIPVPVSTFTGIDASSKWVLNGSKLSVTRGDGTKTEYTVVNSTPTLKLQWQGMLNYPAPDPTVYTFNMELKK
ncbi:lipocalin family protein [Spirosoma spitsbergense]|uniref:lipocalin family protein n=1 Tax=Spirosoma spitsbergense TaxID=431554 RepID=UPI000372437B|nr:lipocalin family protein [Spirosoma spitsbergense]